MSQLLVLLRLDFLRIRNWFRSYAATKAVVILGFVFVVAIVVAVEYLFARSFFILTATHKEFGAAVAQYSINAALLLLFLIGVVSSIQATNAALFYPGFLRHLLSTPIPAARLFLSRIALAFFHSTLVFVLLLTPILIAYGASFANAPYFIERTITVLIILALSTQAVGAMITLILVQKFGRIQRKMIAGLFVLVIAGSLLLMRFLFPPAFFRLYHAEDWPAFQEQLGALPLLSLNLPTNWLASTITHSWSLESAIAIATTAALVTLALSLGSKMYFESWSTAQEGRFLAGGKVPKPGKPTSYPMLIKNPTIALCLNEFLGVMRSPAEATYLAFLSGLLVVLLFLIRNVPALEKAAPSLLPHVYSLSLVGISYLFMTLSARLVYPLMAREKRTSWLLFSVPIKREALLNSKILFAFLLITLPSAVVGFFAATAMEFTGSRLVAYTLFLLLCVLVVALIQLFLGTIAPNFAESDNLEAASTSGSGLAAISLSLIFIALVGLGMYLVVVAAIGVIPAFVSLLALALLILLPLFSLARRNLYRYNL